VPRMNALQIRQSMDHGKNGNGLIIVLVAGGITLLVAAAGLWIWFRKKR